MKIDKEKCIACKNCYPYCPDNAILIKDGYLEIDEDLCFECGTCLRVEVCPTDAIYEPDYVYEFPRSVRKFFSDPSTNHAETNMPGRGTEEVKTNDVTNRTKKGFLGIGLEIGRPLVGTRLSEVEKVTKMLAENGFNSFEECNPVIGLMKDTNTGELKEEVLNERLLSAIIEFDIVEADLKKCLDLINKIAEDIDTVITIDLISCYDPGMELRIDEVVQESNFSIKPNAKVNIGVGRPN
ncbi:MAG: 4Fe-4S binding protein [Bacillota bacterium]